MNRLSQPLGTATLQSGVVLCPSCRHNVLGHVGGRCQGLDYDGPMSRGQRLAVVTVCTCTAVT